MNNDTFNYVPGSVQDSLVVVSWWLRSGCEGTLRNSLTRWVSKLSNVSTGFYAALTPVFMSSVI